MPLEAPVSQPDGFLTVGKALQKEKDSIVNVIGIVNHVLPVISSRGRDWQFAINIQDTSVTTKLCQGQSIKVKWFIGSADLAPKIENIGDTVILRNFKVSYYANAPLLLSRWGSECIVFPSNTMPDPHFNDSYASGQTMLHYSCMPSDSKRPTPGQQVWAIHIRHVLCSTITAKPMRIAGASTKTSCDKFNLIKNAGPEIFFDLVVEVVRTFEQAHEVYVTDYTENNLLYRYSYPDEDQDMATSRDGDAFGHTDLSRRRAWPGPFGQLTMQVKLWEPHGSHAFNTMKIKEGDVIELKNVHIKMDSSGTKIDGALHGDRKFPDRINVVSTKHWDKRIQELEYRKEAYITAMRNREQRSQGKQSRRDRRKGKRTMGKEKQATAQSEDHADESDYLGSNSHVKCERPNDQKLLLTDIENNDKRRYRTPNGVDCELPFVNAMYRARVRVVDFWPERLEDFAKSLDSEFDDVNLEDQTQSSTTTYTALSAGTQRWEWHFCLLVEDSKQHPGVKDPVRIPLLVFDKAADCLLRLDATDLRKDKKALALLREKLFILWGNLEELKSAGGDPFDEAVAKRHSSNAFDCCIKETGTATESHTGQVGAGATLGYQRIYHLHGTTIHS